jgi:hypothetical protein
LTCSREGRARTSSLASPAGPHDCLGRPSGVTVSLDGAANDGSARDGPLGARDDVRWTSRSEPGPSSPTCSVATAMQPPREPWRRRHPLGRQRRRRGRAGLQPPSRRRQHARRRTRQRHRRLRDVPGRRHPLAGRLAQRCRDRRRRGNVENVHGSLANDVLVGNAGPNVLDGATAARTSPAARARIASLAGPTAPRCAYATASPTLPTAVGRSTSPLPTPSHAGRVREPANTPVPPSTIPPLGAVAPDRDRAAREAASPAPSNTNLDTRP